MDHQKADENRSNNNESNSPIKDKSGNVDKNQSRRRSISRQQLQELGERELWVSAMTSWLKWPQLGYDGKIRMTLIRM